MLNRQRVITDRYLLFVFCLSHRLFTLTKACLNLMLDGTRITKRSLFMYVVAKIPSQILIIHVKQYVFMIKYPTFTARTCILVHKLML